jgi:hypothetical protein
VESTDRSQEKKNYAGGSGPEDVGMIAFSQKKNCVGLAVFMFLASTFLSFYPCSLSNIVTDNKLRAI